MTLELSKTLGGVGALLMVIGPFIGAYSGVLGLIGLILVMIALKGLSGHYNDAGIFNNALYGFILAIIGGVVFVAVIVVAAVGLLTDLGIEVATWGDPAAFQSIDWQNLVTWDILWPYIAAIVGSLVVLFVFVVVAGVFLRRSWTILSEKTGVGLFGTAGLLTLIGAILTIVAIGFLLLWVALILLTVAFFRIKTQSTPPPATVPPPPP